MTISTKGRWGGRHSPHVAEDFGIGELSSTDMEKFRRASPSKQNELIRLLEQIKRATDLGRKQELQRKLRELESSM